MLLPSLLFLQNLFRRCREENERVRLPCTIACPTPRTQSQDVSAMTQTDFGLGCHILDPVAAPHVADQQSLPPQVLSSLAMSRGSDVMFCGRAARMSRKKSG